MILIRTILFILVATVASAQETQLIRPLAGLRPATTAVTGGSFTLTASNNWQQQTYGSIPVHVHFGMNSGVTSASTVDIFTKLGAASNKVYFTSGTTNLPAEVEYWNATEQRADFWVAGVFQTWTASNLPPAVVKVTYDSTYTNNLSIGPIGSAAAQAIWTGGPAIVLHMDNATTSHNSGPSAYDFTGYNSPALSNMTPCGGYASYMPSTAYYEYDNSGVPQMTPGQTVSAWIYMTGVMDNTERFIHKWIGSSGNSQYLCSWGGVGNTNMFGAEIVGSGTFNVETGNLMTTVGQWQYCVWGYTNPSNYFMVNDAFEAVNADSDAGDIVAVRTQPHTIGTSGVNTRPYLIDEVRMWTSFLGEHRLRFEYHAQGDTYFIYSTP